MKLDLECTREEDGRWLAEVLQLHGTLAIGDTEADARRKAQALAFRLLAAQLEAGTCNAADISIRNVAVRREGDDSELSLPLDQAAYDAWLAAKVQAALDDESPTMSTEEVRDFVRAGVASK